MDLFGEDLKEFLEKSGVTSSQLNDDDTRKFILDFIKNHSGPKSFKEIPQETPNSSSKLHLKDFFENAGISKKDLLDKNTRNLIANLIKLHVMPIIDSENTKSNTNSQNTKEASSVPPQPTLRRTIPAMRQPPKDQPTPKISLNLDSEKKTLKIPVPATRKCLPLPEKDYPGFDDQSFGRQINQQDLAFSHAALGFERPPAKNQQPFMLINSEGYAWIPTDINACSKLQQKAVLVGYEGNDAIFVGRARQESEILPCKIVPSKKCAYVTHNMRNKPVANFEMYCKVTPTLKWVKSKNGSAPPNGVLAGKTADGENLYIGRSTMSDGSIVMGKVQQSEGCCYVIYNDGVLAVEEYEVMVLQNV
ncbi:uncharacterized protein LOC143911062 isoform X2 [Arctopsyche grandis]